MTWPGGLVSFNTNSPNNDTVVNFENVLTGHSDAEVIGTTGTNLIVSQEGDDSIDGGGGGDSVFSGRGQRPYQPALGRDDPTPAAATTWSR